MTTSLTPNRLLGCSEIFNEFDIIAEFNLLDYDFNMGRLYSDLQSLLQRRFQGGPICFTANERIAFLHIDLDFFLHKDLPGFTLYNLQLILRELDISNCFCLVISNLPEFRRYTQQVRDLLTNDDFAMCGISTCYFNIRGTPLKDMPVRSNEIRWPFAVLSRLRRFHRTYFMSQLFNHRLQDQGMVSYHNLSDPPVWVKKNLPTSINNNHPCHFLSVTPFNNNNPELCIKNPNNLAVVKKFAQQVDSFKNFEESINIADKVAGIHLQNNPLQQALIYVALETTVNCAQPFLSPISFKGICSLRPFVLVAVPGSLAYLRSLGFQTFDQYWDESYDHIQDFESRVEAVLHILSDWSSKSTPELQQIADHMRPVLEHNFNHIKHVLPGLELESMRTQARCP